MIRSYMLYPENGKRGEAAQRQSSAAASAPTRVSKTHRSRARSGRLQRRVRCSGIRHSGCHPHGMTTPARNHAGITGVRSEPRSSRITPCTTGLNRNHVQHNEPSYHTLHNELSAQRALVPLLHNGLGTTEPAYRAFNKRDPPHQIKTRNVGHAPRTPNGLPLSCAASIDR